MSGTSRGVQALFRQEVPQAVYVHCMNHRLNLVIVDVCKAIKPQFVLSEGRPVEEESPDSKETFRVKVFLPVLDHLIAELTRRFTENNDVLCGVSALHPQSENFMDISLLKPFAEHYACDIDSVEVECKARSRYAASLPTLKHKLGTMKDIRTIRMPDMFISKAHISEDDSQYEDCRILPPNLLKRPRHLKEFFAYFYTLGCDPMKNADVEESKDWSCSYVLDNEKAMTFAYDTPTTITYKLCISRKNVSGLQYGITVAGLEYSDAADLCELGKFPVLTAVKNTLMFFKNSYNSPHDYEKCLSSRRSAEEGPTNGDQ
ncbi:hypothetical protein HPB52_002339 [Rhipicephalus sanguineus]|uniref:DUF4371 domain-containing protein n=1 Tax=Rhipicephalus sanguineus TaxID=34632 RepID=A0A9D4QC21_RHISA|nr:hypothetical protein HPB52_002339 [Rhipicephalus sanguineus]